MMSVSWASVCFCTSAERRSRIFMVFPMEVLPLASAPWQAAHLDLYTFAASFCARAGNVEQSNAADSATAELTRTIPRFISTPPRRSFLIVPSRHDFQKAYTTENVAVLPLKSRSGKGVSPEITLGPF